MPSCFVMLWHCLMQLVVCMLLSSVSRSCSLTRLSSHGLTLKEVADLKKPQSSERVWLWLSWHVQKEHSLAWRLAVARLPHFGRCYVSVVVEVIVPAWWLFQQSCLSCGQGLVGRCPSLCTCFESFIGAVVHSNPLSNSLYRGEGNVLQCCHVLSYCLGHNLRETSSVRRPPSWGDLPKDGKVCASWWRLAHWSWRCFSLTVYTSVWPLSAEDAIHSSLSLDLTEECRRDWKQKSAMQVRKNVGYCHRWTTRQIRRNMFSSPWQTTTKKLTSCLKETIKSFSFAVV